jgi:hypothetical protein
MVLHQVGLQDEVPTLALHTGWRVIATWAGLRRQLALDRTRVEASMPLLYRVSRHGPPLSGGAMPPPTIVWVVGQRRLSSSRGSVVS